MDGGTAYIFFLFVILKIPVVAAMALVWWAIKAEPVTDDAPPSDQHQFKRPRPEPKAPRGPRRGGPHGGAVKPEVPEGARHHRGSDSRRTPTGARD